METPEPRKRLSKTMIERMVTLLLGGFSFVAALAWNDAVQSLFHQFFDPKGSGVQIKFIYAIAITVVITLLTLQLSYYVGEKE